MPEAPRSEVYVLLLGPSYLGGRYGQDANGGSRRSPTKAFRTGQRLLNPLTVKFEADHLLREPLDYLAETGFEIEEPMRSKWGIVERSTARKPA